MLILSTAGTQAVNLIWDAGNTSPGTPITPASGAWDINTSTNINWYNGTANVSWSQTSTTAGSGGAIFQGPGAAAGTYQVTVDGGQVAATNMVINANGYQFNGSPIYLTIGPLPLLMISNGVNVVFSNNLTGAALTGNNGVAELRAGDNGPASIININGAVTGWQPSYTSTNGSIFYISNSTATAIADGTAYVDADVRVTDGTWNSSGALLIGVSRGSASSSQPNNQTGKLTFDGANTILNHTSDYISLGRNILSGWNAVMNIQNGATVNYQTGTHNNNVGLGIPRPGSSGANSISVLNVYGGTLNMGPASGSDATSFPRTIFIANGGSANNEVSALNQTGGTIFAWGGVQMGGSGTYSGGTAGLTNSGGFLYIGNFGGDGIKNGGTLAPTNLITLSGGTIGALAAWHSPSTLPITLGTLNGNVTFQAADNNGNGYGITLDQVLSGPGGFYKTGSGQLTLNGINTYMGSTVVSNGTLYLVTPSTSGPATLDGSAGSPNLIVSISNPGQTWTVGGSMTFQSGTPQVDFLWGSATPSTSVAPIQSAGNLNFTATPNVVATNGSFFRATYPLISYMGGLSGTPPTTATLPAGVSGYVTNIAAAREIALVITVSPNNPSYVWTTNSEAWNYTSNYWTTNGVFTAWQDGNVALFNDTNVVPGSTNITVTLNANVSPSSTALYGLEFNNFSNSYIISGTGMIASGAIDVKGNGNGPATVTLATTNTYSGGTTLEGGSLLNINSGGNGSGSPVGTGALTINANSQLGNSSGSAVALQYPVPGNWNGNFSYVGANDLDLGSGSITLLKNTTVTVMTNNLSTEGSISDGGSGYGLTKTGNGTLTLAGNNSWSSVQENAGQLNFNSSGAAGSANFTFMGGSVDNTSGSPVALNTGAWILSGLASGGVFTFLGSNDLDVSVGTIAANNGNSIVFNIVSNIFTTAAVECGNTLIVKNGNGTWVLGGADTLNTALVTVNAGEFDMARLGGSPAIGTGGAGDITGSGHGLVVNSNALAVLDGPISQIAHASGGNSYIEVILNSGILDMYGNSQAVDMISMTNGVLRESAPGSTSTLTITGTLGTHPTNAITLNGTNCGFDVPPVDGNLNISALVNGAGTLVKTGLGTVTLQQSNAYTGNITVNAGILNQTYEDMSSTAVVTIASGAVLGLNYGDSGTNIIAGLVLNGASAALGLHNSGTDPIYLTGSGNLLVVTPPPSGPIAPTNPPTITRMSLSGNNLVLTGTNGDTGATYYLLDTTNLIQPVPQWKTIATNVASGNVFSFTGTNAVTPGTAQQFYMLSSTNYNP